MSGHVLGPNESMADFTPHDFEGNPSWVGQGTREKSGQVRSPRLDPHFGRKLAVRSASAGLDARLPYLWPQP